MAQLEVFIRLVSVDVSLVRQWRANKSGQSKSFNRRSRAIKVNKGSLKSDQWLSRLVNGALGTGKQSYSMPRYGMGEVINSRTSAGFSWLPAFLVDGQFPWFPVDQLGMRIDDQLNQFDARDLTAIVYQVKHFMEEKFNNLSRLRFSDQHIGITMETGTED